MVLRSILFSLVVLSVKQRGISSFGSANAFMGEKSYSTNRNHIISLHGSSSDKDGSKKRIVFVRHGKTYMNEYMSEPGQEWGAPNFSDMLLDPEKFQDSPLSPRGENQAKELARQISHIIQGKDDDDASLSLSLSDDDKSFMDDLDLVVVSPLTRALQTFTFGLKPHMKSVGMSGWANSDERSVNVVALPFAAERCYLISDIGRPRVDLQIDFPFVDFESGFNMLEEPDGPWWFTIDEDEKAKSEYVEWRPSEDGQKYACFGESQEIFDQRMTQLYLWLQERKESTIAVVCHWGVIDWMLDADFKNCELRVIPFDDIRPSALKSSEALTGTYVTE